VSFQPTQGDVPPSEILKDILVAANVGKFGASRDSTDWGIYIMEEPAEPSNAVTIYEGLEPERFATQGPEEEDGELWTPQTRVRGSSYLDAYRKALQISDVLNKYGRIETDSFSYPNIVRNGAPFPLPKDDRERFIFVQNWKVWRMQKRSA